MKRRDFFSSFSLSSNEEQEKENLVRPPYYKDENYFSKQCISCDGICVDACEENIIFISKNKTPYLDFYNGGCTYCDECANICHKNVLNLEFKKKISSSITLDITKCLSWNDVMCFSCKDPCLDDAIKFLTIFKPEILDNCTLCGFCISKCPSSAISIEA